MDRTIAPKIIQLTVLSLLLLSSVLCASSTAINTPMTIPLRYYPSYGIYTTSINIGILQRQALEAVIDTGSAVLVLVTAPKKCPSCVHSFTKGRVDPDQFELINENQEKMIRYGSADDTVKEFEAAVAINQAFNPILMKIYLIYQSDQPASVLGLIPHNIKSDPVNSTPFIRKITNNFNTHKHMTFVLCANKGKSYLQFGNINLPKEDVATPLLITPFYEMNISGIFDKNNQSIAKTLHPYNPAVLDTGTGGFIILTANLYKPLLQYLYTSAGPKNQQLSSKFWHKNYCVPRSRVDFNAFPLLRIGVAPLTGNQQQYLELPATSYISGAGCPKDYVRMAFNLVDPPKLLVAMRNYNARKLMGRTPEMVIGTSLFNHYAFRIQFQPAPIIRFYENTALCINPLNNAAKGALTKP
jgi:hypothetical protein